MKEQKETKKASIQLANSERLVKTFNYSSFEYGEGMNAKETVQRLIVTSKRIIHESICEKRGNEHIVRREIPVSSAKYINTVIGKKFKIKYLILAIIFGVLALLSIIFALINAERLLGIAAAVSLVFGVINLIFYYVRRMATVCCVIGTDHSITPAMSFLSYSDNTESTDKKSNKIPSLKVYVNTEVAQKLSNELGAAIIDANSGNASINNNNKKNKL